MYIERHLEKAVEKADRFFPALLLTGARQVGKTTFLRRIAGRDRKYVTFDDVGLRTLAKEDPKGFLDRFTPPVLLDEVQYVPELLSYIKETLKAREPFYTQARHIVDVSLMDNYEKIAITIDLLRKELGV